MVSVKFKRVLLSTSNSVYTNWLWKYNHYKTLYSLELT